MDQKWSGHMLCALLRLSKGKNRGDVYKLHLLHNPIRPDFRKIPSSFSATSLCILPLPGPQLVTAHLSNQSTQQLAKIVWGIHFYPFLYPPGFLQDSKNSFGATREIKICLKRVLLNESPIGSMGLVYLPTFVNVGKYTICGSYWSLNTSRCSKKFNSTTPWVLGVWDPFLLGKKRQGCLAVL